MPKVNAKQEQIILELINVARSNFIKQSKETKTQINDIQIFKIKIDTEEYCIFGIEKNLQNKDIIRNARYMVLKEIGLPLETPIIQVIGDSACFQNDKTDIAKDFLYRFLNKHPKALILYGTTGNSNKSTKQFDTNGLLNAWVDENLNDRSYRVLGNVVDYHTPMAIEQWGCNVGDIRNIFLVYTCGEASAKFGDDVISSDYIVKNQRNDNSHEDFCICLEGGVQSFNQIVRLLNDGVKVFALKGIRGDKNPACFDKQSGQFIPYFSATEYLSILKEMQLKKAILNVDDINELLANYIYNPETDGPYNITCGKRVYANPARHDYSTKAALMSASLKEFIEQETWKKLELLTITDASEFTKCSNLNVSIINKFSNVFIPSHSNLVENIEKEKKPEQNTNCNSVLDEDVKLRGNHLSS